MASKIRQCLSTSFHQLWVEPHERQLLSCLRPAADPSVPTICRQLIPSDQAVAYHQEDLTRQETACRFTSACYPGINRRLLNMVQVWSKSTNLQVSFHRPLWQKHNRTLSCLQWALITEWVNLWRLVLRWQPINHLPVSIHNCGPHWRQISDST